MAKRVRLDSKDRGGLYFTSDKKGIEFINSGCCMLDNILGGGYPLGRMTNIIGDKSSCKTLLATEAIINFLVQYPKGVARYCEAESAFDLGYAEAMGMPVNKVDFGDEEEPVLTVEDLYRDLDSFLFERLKKNQPGIYVVDSLDGLADEASLKLDISEGTYGGTKQKQINKLFTHMHRRIKKSRVNLMIISQVRDIIGPSFGEKQRRNGGKSLDFYASQFLWLHHKAYISSRTIKKVKRPIGITVKAKVKKNKVGLPFRECEFDFLFGFGVLDIETSIKWLKEIGRLDAIDLTNNAIDEYLKELDEMNDNDYEEERHTVSKQTKKIWHEVEENFLPRRRKYR